MTDEERTEAQREAAETIAAMIDHRAAVLLDGPHDRTAPPLLQSLANRIRRQWGVKARLDRAD